MLTVVPALVVLLALQAGVWAFVVFLAILLFGVFAYASLSRHLRRSRRPWPGEPGYRGDNPDDTRPDAR